MEMSTLAMTYIFILAILAGIEVIGRVPTVLHTPLMSGANAIHGIVLVGGIYILGTAGGDVTLKIIGFAAVVLGTLNVVGGFVVTDRMLEMFKAKKKADTK
ncbi:MAG: NAD(P) transhydrogenase subunit alpha [Deltaproteobacteria bacterium]|nr:NAD(P) transhydrogenase subunit alpha [Deltaproteobacteria bacterium]